MLEQPLPERISFIRGFLQSKSLRRRRGKRLPPARCPPTPAGVRSCVCRLPPPLSDPPRCTSSFTRCGQGCPDPAAACGKESFPMKNLARARAWCKGGAGGEGQGAGACCGDAVLGRHSSPGAWPQAAQIPLGKTFTRAGILGGKMGSLLRFCSASPGRGDAVSHLVSHPP